jgi:hypothetical protein
MISRFPEISQTKQELLFFANKKAIKDNFNLLAYTEVFNETLNYTTKWILELDNVKDEFDWEFHRSKLLTRFVLATPIMNIDYVLNQLEKNMNSNDFHIIKGTMVSTSVAWNNAIYYARNDQYKDESNPQTWELWEIINHYKNDNLDAISANKKHLKEFSKIIKYRKNDNFFDGQRVNLTDKDLRLIEELENKLSKVIFKEELTKEIPIISAVRKRLKL